jgi:succinate dehydrogenase / fumarate reductase iron-sulfur subunit
LNVTAVLQRIAIEPRTSDGEITAPIAYEANCLEEVCGSCTMLINGRTRQACSALVDKLLVDNPDEIELRPLDKFPVVRDLVVDRRRLFRALEKVQAWIRVDGYYDLGPGPRQSPREQQQA